MLILAGTLANSGLEANVVKFSTASISGAVATRHLFLFSSEKSPSKAWKVREWNKKKKGCMKQIALKLTVLKLPKASTENKYFKKDRHMT